MAKSEEQQKARELRKAGISVRQIATQLKVSKSSVSKWVQDIDLTTEQIEKLRQQNIKGGAIGRLRGALKQKKERLQRIQLGKKEGIARFPFLTEKELFVIGIALYWAEGSKKQRKVEFCNSDPNLLVLMIDWLRICFSIDTERLRCRVGINDIHKTREHEVKLYWSKITGVPLAQFSQTSFKRVQNKKLYDNLNTHYGTLSVIVLKPGQLYYNIIGLIEGMYYAYNRQRSSVVEHRYHKPGVAGSIPAAGTFTKTLQSTVSNSTRSSQLE